MSKKPTVRKTKSPPAHTICGIYRNVQDEMFEQAAKFGHKFMWAIDNDDAPVVPGKSQPKRYNSADSIDTFIKLYSIMPKDQKMCHEIIQNNFYMFFDLDLKIDQIPNYDPNIHTPLNVFFWFDAIYNEFVNYIIANCPNHLEQLVVNTDQDIHTRPLSKISFNFLKPDWIVTSASDHTKISLHLLNRNVIFPDMFLFKLFYEELKSYCNSFLNPNDPYRNAIDFGVATNNRLMRMTDSAKFGSNRFLQPFREFHETGIKLKDTFITNARNDPKINQKLFIERYVSYLFTKKEQTKKTAKTITHFEPIDSKNNAHLEQIKELLSLLHISRADDRKYWVNIAFIFKHHNLPYELFEQFSRRSNKFDPLTCQTFFDELDLKPTDKPLTLGALHFYAREDNPDKYNEFKLKYQVFTIDLPFTPHKTINERFIPKDLYLDAFSRHNLIALKSCMMTGKTHALPEVFEHPEYASIVVVYFRVSLSKELAAKWKALGFVIYSDLKGPIDLSKHPRVIIQIDSIHRLLGKTDLLILDEIESTYSHLCSSKYLDHQDCFNTLRSYINYSPKVLFADANLADDTINVLAENRLKECIKILNEYKSFTDLKASFFNDTLKFQEHIIQLLRQNKRIVIPTNSLQFSKQISTVIATQFPERNVLLINSEGGNTPVANWSDYDVLIYTPTIVAGVSFDKLHYHTCCAYFINRSSNAEMSSQMLFRVRHLIDKQMYIYCPESNPDKQKSRSITNEEIYDDLNERIKLGHSHSVASEGLLIDRYQKRVEDNQYYRLYCAFIRKKNLSILHFQEYLQKILQFHGITMKKEYRESGLTEDERSALVTQIVDSKEILKKENAQHIINATPINHSTYLDLIQSKQEKTREQQFSVARHYLTSSTDLKFNDSLKDQEEWVAKTLPHLKAINNVRPLIGLNIQQAIQICEQKHADRYDQDLLNKASSYDRKNFSSDSEDDEDPSLFVLESDKNLLPSWRPSMQVIRKRYIKKTVIQSIHYERKWLKMKVCLDFLYLAGFTILDTNEKVKVNWQAVHRYCVDHEHQIRVLFDIEKKIWKPDYTDDEKQSLVQYVNNKLKTMLCLTLKATSSKAINYIIQFCVQMIAREEEPPEPDQNIIIDNLPEEEFYTSEEEPKEEKRKTFLI